MPHWAFSKRNEILEILQQYKVPILVFRASVSEPNIANFKNQVSRRR